MAFFLVIHLGYHSLWLTETRDSLLSLRGPIQDKEDYNRLRVANAPVRSPWRFLNSLGRMAWVLLHRAYFFMRSILLAIPIWQWTLMVAVSAFFRRKQ